MRDSTSRYLAALYVTIGSSATSIRCKSTLSGRGPVDKCGTYLLLLAILCNYPDRSELIRYPNDLQTANPPPPSIRYKPPSPSLNA
ncbi:hypothetical protein QC762_0038620 [Podospora pseudocomata]|uniref:Uncharacterized protein n=1 Tax=Podospora pseudocomata TaxID=2093779 RepID=A0ABR0GM43_9PEZI|nr:hypothetical protein QC762_0038620 [Podospora pseudocomata]